MLLHQCNRFLRSAFNIKNMSNKLSTVAPAACAEEARNLQNEAMSENCLLVDKNDHIIGQSSKKDCHLVQSDGSVKLHRAFSVFLFNSKGEMLLQRRSPYKITFPDCYTNACCSHPLCDIHTETIDQDAIGIKSAAQRRLNFELGIPFDQAKPEDFQYLTRIQYQDTGDGIWGEHEIDYVLFLHKDVDLKPNPSEVSEIRYLSRENIDNQIAKLDGPLSPWFNLILKYRLKLWWDNLNQLDKYKDHKNIQRF